MVPLLQNTKWQKLQTELGEITFLEAGKGYSFLAIKKSTPVGSYLYLPYGPVLEDSKAAKAAFSHLKRLAKQQKAFFVRIEPQNTQILPFLQQNAKKSHDLNPADTWILDLSGDEADFKSKIPSRLQRYYRNREKAGLEIFTSKNPADVKFLVDLQQNLAKTKKISTFSEKYLKTELTQDFATLYLVKFTESAASTPQKTDFSAKNGKKAPNSTSNSQIVAAGLVFDDGNTRYNLQGAQSSLGAKLHATGILTIQLILDARAKKLQFFDFWGIAPENAPKNHPWAGFTGFKKTFSGTSVSYCGTWDLILSRPKYAFYQLFRTLNRIIRKIK